MSKGKMKAVLLLIVLLLALAVACNLLIDLTENKTEDNNTETTPTVDPYAAATETPAALATIAPASTPAATQSSSWQTLQPAPTTAATTAPVATVAPTTAPTSAPADTAIGSGSFTSETGLPINIRADWTATVYDASTVKVTVSVYLLSYQIQTQALTDAVNVSVGDDYETEDAPAVENDNNVQVTTLLATTTHYVSLASGSSGTFPVAVEYHFRGSYSGEELPVIECGGNISLSR